MPWKWFGVGSADTGTQKPGSAILISIFQWMNLIGMCSMTMTSVHAEKGEPMAEYIKKWPVVDKLTALENELQQYKPFRPCEATMYKRICDIEIEIGKMDGDVNDI